MRKFTVLVAAVTAAAILSSCGEDSSSGGAGGSAEGGAAEDVRIAGLWPLSGANATQGTDVLHGAELAVEIINGEYPDLELPLAAEAGLPGLDGAQLELITGDTQGDPEVGASEVDRLVTSEGVVSILGSYQSGVTLTASQRAERLGIPFVNGASSSVALTDRGFEWFFRTGPNDETFARTMFEYLQSMRDAGQEVETISVFHSNDQFGNDGAAVTAEVAEELGFEVVGDVPFDPAAADLTSQVTQVRSQDPDVMFVLAYTDGAIKLMQTLDQLDYYPAALLAYGSGFADPAFVTGLGDLANGASSRAAWSAEIAQQRPAAATVAEMFEAEYDAPMTENSARSFTAVLALAQAIDAAGSTEPGAIRDALRELDVPAEETIMPWTGISFDDTGQNTGARGVVEQLVDGEYRVIFPEEFATVEPTWPMNGQ
ncbi:ABC transporter substrate-binding protein [Jiangella mangrovi]|uniref:Branched-chain amino acid transport system substrate-binding protein n=1 Tax=Jiangella mangrovi TaxID=1524084 RepID=A0A7W9GSN3_9ACTN|nr:ABC transporter substrate-binding protein [Jiangella mangrovi]MBB5789330.1 branched-chain amino acid transport system substrate-binding protein [Jiangella mangrovi]